ERKHPEIINASRRKRIARGSGTEISDVNRLIGQFKKMKKTMKKFKKMKNSKSGISNFLPF
ncbi:MAG TPA: signal recognition particle protein, partial [Candidatus Atribacteria bacterium]|nr:signal recognition particle protein [Candidatus Atribacteria bacterium]